MTTADVPLRCPSSCGPLLLPADTAGKARPGRLTGACVCACAGGEVSPFMQGIAFVGRPMPPAACRLPLFPPSWCWLLFRGSGLLGGGPLPLLQRSPFGRQLQAPAAGGLRATTTTRGDTCAGRPRTPPSPPPLKPRRWTTRGPWPSRWPLPKRCAASVGRPGHSPGIEALLPSTTTWPLREAPSPDPRPASPPVRSTAPVGPHRCHVTSWCEVGASGATCMCSCPRCTSATATPRRPRRPSAPGSRPTPTGCGPTPPSAC